MNNDTPKTEAAASTIKDDHFGWYNFARELERENARLREDCLRMARALGIEEQYKCLMPNTSGEPCPPPANQPPENHE